MMRSHPHGDGLLPVRSVLPHPLHRLGTADNNRTEWTDHSEVPTSLVAALLLDDIAEAHGLMRSEDRGTCHACASWAESDEDGYPHHLSWQHEWNVQRRKSGPYLEARFTGLLDNIKWTVKYYDDGAAGWIHDLGTYPLGQLEDWADNRADYRMPNDFQWVALWLEQPGALEGLRNLCEAFEARLSARR